MLMLTLARQYALDDCLRQQNLLTNEDLIIELTDHFTLSLDQQMADGVSFETALAHIVTNFGGRKELQQMERRYNAVTFGRYTAVWKEAALSQFKGARLWITLIYFSITAYLFTMTPVVHSSSMTGIIWGLFAGMILVNVITGGKQYVRYIKTVYERGFHNPPTEIQYTLTRVLGCGIVLYCLGVAVFYLAGAWPFLLHPIIVASYLTSTIIYVNSYGLLNRHLYNISPSTWYL